MAKPRDTYRYTLRKGNRITYRGITNRLLKNEFCGMKAA